MHSIATITSRRQFCTTVKTPSGYWTDKNNQRKFFDKLAIELQIKKPEDWRQVRVRTVMEKGGWFLKRYYNESLIQALSAAYPEWNWKVVPKKPVNFKPAFYWADIRNQRLFFDQLAEALNIEKPADWYTVDLRTVYNKGGWFIMKYYKSSLIKALSAVYPEHKWEAYQKPKAYWSDKDNQRFFFDQLAKTLNIKKPEDWYYIRVKTIMQHGGYFVSNYYSGSLIRALNAVYPHYNLKRYNRLKMVHGDQGPLISKSQLFLYQKLKELFPDTVIEQNFRFTPNPGLQKANPFHRLLSIEFDMFIPTFLLAFEYQGEAHYKSSITYGSATQRQKRDSAKQDYAQREGITLIPIPFWWDKTIESLAATINAYRPDVIDASKLSAIAPPVPLEMPVVHKQKFLYKPNVPQKYDNRIDPKNWLMMEKIDGLRVFWDGKTLYSKELRITIDLPKDCPFPTTSFEGEIWMGYNKRFKCVPFLQSQNRDWTGVKIIAFDAPHVMDMPYIERLSVVKKTIPPNHPILSVVKTVECKDRKHFETFFNQTCKNQLGGGVILRNPTAWYFEADSFFEHKLLVEATVMQLETGEFKWPNGEIRSLSLHMRPKEQFLVVRYLPDMPEKAMFVSTVESTEDLFDQMFQYHIAYPSAAALCRGCGKQLDPRKLCIQTQLIYKSRSVPISFCIVEECLKHGLLRYVDQINTCKPFQNVIWAYEADLEKVEHRLPNVKWEIIPDEV